MINILINLSNWLIEQKNDTIKLPIYLVKLSYDNNIMKRYIFKMILFNLIKMMFKNREQHKYLRINQGDRYLNNLDNHL